MKHIALSIFSIEIFEKEIKVCNTSYPLSRGCYEKKRVLSRTFAILCVNKTSIPISTKFNNTEFFKLFPQTVILVIFQYLDCHISLYLLYFFYIVWFLYKTVFEKHRRKTASLIRSYKSFKLNVNSLVQ